MVRGFEPLIDSMTCHSKDRHVLAAAVHADAGAIVTFNVRDLPNKSLAPYSIEVIHPDNFLLDAVDLAPTVEGWNDVDGERIYFVSNPGQGLWAHRGDFVGVPVTTEE